MKSFQILIYCPDRHILYDGRTPDKVGVGGGITARVRMAQALARQGHQVIAQVNCAEPIEHQGVKYLPLDAKPPRQVDILVAGSTGHRLDLTPLEQLTTEYRLRILVAGGAVKPSGVNSLEHDFLYAVSNFIRDVAVERWGLPPYKLFVAYNGIEEAIFTPLAEEPHERDPYRLTYLGHPAKGMEPALSVLARLRAVDDRFHLHVYGGRALWGENPPPADARPGVVDHGLIGQRELARALEKCSFALHLQTIEEAFGISLAESMRAGCLTLASPVGAFPELIQHGSTGYLLPGDPATEQVHLNAAELVLSALEHRDKADAIRLRARRFPWTWDRMARVWTEHWQRVLGESSGEEQSSAVAICPACAGAALRLEDGLHCPECGRYYQEAISLDRARNRDGSRPERGKIHPSTPKHDRAADSGRVGLSTGWSTVRLRQALPAPLKRLLKKGYYVAAGWASSRQIDLWRREIGQIVGRHPHAREIVIFPPSLRWAGSMFQRPHQLAAALAQAGALVFFMEREAPAERERIERAADRLYLARVHPAAFDQLQDPAIYLLTWNRDERLLLPSGRWIYDYLDDLRVFPGANRTELKREHESLANRAALVLATSRPLLDQIRQLRGDALYSPNGVDYEHFVQARSPLVLPDDLSDILERGKPIVGYHGALADWFAQDLLLETAQARPDLSFVLIGPDYDGSLDFAHLEARPNIHWVGPVEYQDLPSYLSHFDVAAIPFKLNLITHATSPIKLFEYMAAGVPVVATAMQETMSYEGVLITDGSAADFSDCIDRALGRRYDREYQELLDQVARANTWHARAVQILGALARDSDLPAVPDRPC